MRDNHISDENLKHVDNSSADRLARYRLIEGDVVCVCGQVNQGGSRLSPPTRRAGWSAPPAPRLDEVCDLLGRCDDLVEVHTHLRRVTSALRDCLVPLVIPETLPDSYPDLLAGPAVREGWRP